MLAWSLRVFTWNWIYKLSSGGIARPRPIQGLRLGSNRIEILFVVPADTGVAALLPLQTFLSYTKLDQYEVTVRSLSYNAEKLCTHKLPKIHIGVAVYPK